MKSKKITIKDIANLGECPCSMCSSQDNIVQDNFEQVGKDNFTKAALLALEVSKSKPEDC